MAANVNPNFMRPAPASVQLTVGSPWGERDGRLHQGMDLAMPEGTPLYALADGVVTRVQPDIDPEAGRWVGVKYPNGMISRHLHMSRVGDVAVGKIVRQGDIIGYSGNTGHSSGPHLHLALHAPIALLPAIAAAVGKPTAGWGPTSTYGTAIPAEPWVPVDGYRPSTLVKMAARGVRTWQGKSGLATLASSGMSAFVVGLVLGAGGFLWRRSRLW